MGGCCSASVGDQASGGSSRRSGSGSTTTAAHIITLNGDLRPYHIPISVSQVLQMEQQHHPSSSSSSSSSSSDTYFLCNSDCLYFDDYIPALESHYQLLPNQIYFLLPTSMLIYPLSASDMADLAVKASVALQNTASSSRRRSSNNKKKGSRISPDLLLLNNNNTTSTHRDYDATASVSDAQSLMKRKKMDKDNKIGSGGGLQNKPSSMMPGASSMRKLQRYSSRRARMAVRSFRLRLTTINEGSILLF